MKKSDANKKRKTPLVIKLVIVAVCTFSIMSTIKVQMDISSRKQELDNLNAQITTQSLKNREVLGLVQSTGDDSYMEKMAREKWGYVYPEERVYIDVSGN